MIEIQIHNEELDSILKNISENIQHIEDTGEKIENYPNINLNINNSDNSDYSIQIKKHFINIHDFNTNGQCEDILPIHSDIIFGIRNDNNFPIKIKYGHGYNNVNQFVNHMYGECKIEINNEYSDTIIYPNQISYIFYGYPFLQLFGSIQYFVEICDINIINGINHNDENYNPRDSTYDDGNNVYISTVGSSLRHNLKQFLFRNTICAINNDVSIFTTDNGNKIHKKCNNENIGVNNSCYYLKSQVFSTGFPCSRTDNVLK